MTKGIDSLNADLVSATDDKSKLKIKSKIEELISSAEGAIRKHKREVDYDTKEFTVEMVVNKYKDGLGEDTNELFVPDYQRDFVWPKESQSRLIESLIIGLPIPHIFIADVESSDEDFDGRVEIVDGSQRVRTLHSFLSNELVLNGLKLIPQINGFKYRDFPVSRQRRFCRISIRIIELSNCTEATRRDLFERINTGSDVLKDMEIRKGSLHGSSKLYKGVIEMCANDTLFQKNAPLSDSKISRGESLEFTLRFFAYRENYQNFGHSVRNFLNDYLEKNSNIDHEREAQMICEFNKTMLFTDTYLPWGFRKTENSKTTPRVRFEALAVGIALALEESPDLVPENISAWLFTDEFKKLTTGDASNSRPKVLARIEYVRDKLLGKT